MFIEERSGNCWIAAINAVVECPGKYGSKRTIPPYACTTFASGKRLKSGSRVLGIHIIAAFDIDSGLQLLDQWPGSWFAKDGHIINTGERRQSILPARYQAPAVSPALLRAAHLHRC